MTAFRLFSGSRRVLRRRSSPQTRPPTRGRRRERADQLPGGRDHAHERKRQPRVCGRGIDCRRRDRRQPMQAPTARRTTASERLIPPNVHGARRDRSGRRRADRPGDRRRREPGDGRQRPGRRDHKSPLRPRTRRPTRREPGLGNGSSIIVVSSSIPLRRLRTTSTPTPPHTATQAASSRSAASIRTPTHDLRRHPERGRRRLDRAGGSIVINATNKCRRNDLRQDVRRPLTQVNPGANAQSASPSGTP